MTFNRSLIGVLSLGLTAVIGAGVAAQNQGVQSEPPNAPNQQPAFAGQTRAPEKLSNVAFDVVTVGSGLEFPWGMTFLPNGKMLVTEKPGAVARARQ